MTSNRGSVPLTLREALVKSYEYWPALRRVEEASVEELQALGADLRYELAHKRAIHDVLAAMLAAKEKGRVA